MIRLKQALVVEGKYDRAKLNAIFDAPILETGGFHVMKDPGIREMIRRFAKTTGVVILTDSDPAGRKLRSYLSELCRDGTVYHAFVPEVPGKEPRKPRPGAAGILGVEGIGAETLKQAVLDAVKPCKEETPCPVTVAEWYEAGMTGRPDSAKKRADFLRRHGLPGNLSQKQALRYLNAVPGPDMLRKELEELRNA